MKKSFSLMSRMGRIRWLPDDEISSVCIHGAMLYNINRIVWNSANYDNPKGDVEIIQVANDAKSYKTSNPEI